MMLKRIKTESKDPVEGLYVVEKISKDDIPKPSRHFIKVMSEVKSLPFLNAFTMEEFINQVQNRFVSV